MNNNLLKILSAAVSYGASDVIIKDGVPPMAKVSGTWLPIDYLYEAKALGAKAVSIPEGPNNPFALFDDKPPVKLAVTPIPMEGNSSHELIESILSESGIDQDTFTSQKMVDTTIQFDPISTKIALGLDTSSVDTGIELSESDVEKVLERRYRVNLFHSSKAPEAVIRILHSHIPTLEELGLPRILYELASRQKGLLLITGNTGSGKSSTLAALVGYINNNYAKHVITIEDPIEFVHKSGRSVVTHVQVGKHEDAPSFAAALRASLRQAPDVILVGEIRDRETMAAALTAAETGHLVMGTLHTNSASQTLNRVLDFFDEGNRIQALSQLTSSLIAVISQDLIPRSDGNGRVVAYEVLLANDRVRSAMRERKLHTIDEAIQAGGNEGMTLKENSLAELVRKGVITLDSALAHANDPKLLRRFMS